MNSMLEESVITELRNMFMMQQSEAESWARRLVAEEPDDHPSDEGQRTRKLVRTSRDLVKAMFGVDLSGYDDVFYPYWDNTTPITMAFLDTFVRPGSSVLEIGMGPGLNLIRLAKKHGQEVEIVGTDIDSAYLESCRDLMKQNGVYYPTYEADLLNHSELSGRRFHIVFFNPPYVPVSKKQDYTQPQAAFGGGEEGYDLMLRSMDKLPEALRGDGVLALGINNYYHKDSKVLGWIQERPAIRLAGRFTFGVNTATIYLIKCKQISLDKQDAGF